LLDSLLQEIFVEVRSYPIIPTEIKEKKRKKKKHALRASKETCPS